mgnify:CR=1 FL=1
MIKLPMDYRLSDICRPEIKFNMVVLPQPEGPRMAVKLLGENLPVQGFKICLTASFSTFLPAIYTSYLIRALTRMFSKASSMGGTGSNFRS